MIIRAEGNYNTEFYTPLRYVITIMSLLGIVVAK